MYLIMMIISAFFYYLTEGEIYAFISKKNGFHINLKEGVLCSIYVSFYKIIAFGTGSFVSGIYYLHKKCGIDRYDSLCIFMIQYALHKAAGTFISLACLFFYASFVNLFFYSYKKMISFICFISLYVAMGIFLLSINKIKKNLWIKYRKKSDMGKIKNIVILILLEMLKLAFFYSIPFWIMEQNEITYIQSIVVMAFVFLISGIIPMPGGIGTFDGVFLLLFSKIISIKEAGRILLLYRGMMIFLPCIVKILYHGSVLVCKYKITDKK